MWKFTFCILLFSLKTNPKKKTQTNNVLVRHSTPSLLCIWLSALISLVLTEDVNLEKLLPFTYFKYPQHFPEKAHYSFLSLLVHLLGTIFSSSFSLVRCCSEYLQEQNIACDRINSLLVLVFSWNLYKQAYSLMLDDAVHVKMTKVALCCYFTHPAF